MASVSGLLNYAAKIEMCPRMSRVRAPQATGCVLVINLRKVRVSRLKRCYCLAGPQAWGLHMRQERSSRWSPAGLLSNVRTETAFRHDHCKPREHIQTVNISEVRGQLIRSNSPIFSTTSIYMLSVTDFDRKGTIAEKDSEEYAAVMAWIPMQTVICTVAECSDVCAWLSLPVAIPQCSKIDKCRLSMDTWSDHFSVEARVKPRWETVHTCCSLSPPRTRFRLFHNHACQQPSSGFWQS